MSWQSTLALALHVLVARPGPQARVPADSTQVVANTNRIPAGRLRGDTLTLRLVARVALWHPEGPRGPELPIYAFAEAGGVPQIPGPLIRVPVGTEVRATIRNSLPQPLRLYGLQDRPAAAVDSMELLPGEQGELRFRAGAPGTFLYWGRTARDTFPFGLIEDGQLSGAIVVDSTRGGSAASAPPDRVFVIGLWQGHERPAGTPADQREETLVINGLAWPHTERLTQTVGDTAHWRVINATRRGHPMHLHGFYYRVDARGTALRDSIYSATQQRLAVTERLPAGTTMSMTWSPHTPGQWLFHCHLVEHISVRVRPHDRPPSNRAHLNHALEGMSGLVLGIVVRPRPGERPVAAVVPRRTLRLFVTERANTYGATSAYSFVLQEGSQEPAADSLHIPGSAIVLTRGEPVAITVLNRARVPATVHWHGIELESYVDGVGGWSGMNDRIAPTIAQGDSFVVRFTPRRAGTFIYHTHTDEMLALGAGLYGPLLVVEPGAARDTLTDRVLLLGTAGPFPQSPPSLNGEIAPRAMELQTDATYRLRFINIMVAGLVTVRLTSDTGLQRWRAIGKDGATLPTHQATLREARVQLGAGETWDFEYTPAAPQELTLDLVTVARGLPPIRTRVPVHVRAK
jgi:FtsP/CotA-like multicopper oxidase with cupredoxin domain